MDIKKDELNKKVKETVELSKNLPNPKTKEQQKELDNILKEIKDLDSYLDNITSYRKK